MDFENMIDVTRRECLKLLAVRFFSVRLVELAIETFFGNWHTTNSGNRSF